MKARGEGWVNMETETFHVHTIIATVFYAVAVRSIYDAVPHTVTTADWCVAQQAVEI